MAYNDSVSFLVRAGLKGGWVISVCMAPPCHPGGDCVKPSFRSRTAAVAAEDLALSVRRVHSVALAL